MRKFLIALLLPLLIMVAFNWRLLFTLFTSWLTSRHPQPMQTIEEQADNSILIPELGIKAPIILSQTNPLEVTDWQIIKRDLTSGVSLADKLAKPGQEGPTVITGHSSDFTPHQYSAVFAPLGQAKVGLVIQIKFQGQAYRYSVAEKHIVKPTDKSFFNDQLIQTHSSRLLLVTCWPILTTTNRLVIVATPI